MTAILQTIFLNAFFNENVWLSIIILLKFGPSGSI